MKHDSPKCLNMTGLALCLFVISTFMPAVTLAEATYIFKRMWPTLQQPWYFRAPRDVAVDTNGYVYVSDTYNHRVNKFSSTGQFLTKWGREGSGGGEFGNPAGITADNRGYVYVADTGNDRIQKFTADGSFLLQWGLEGTGEGEFSAPWDVVLDVAGNVYVADSGNNRIQKFSENGVFVKTWGTAGSGEGEFKSMRGLAIDANGNIYVADFGNDRIQKFSPEGVFITQWGGSTTGAGELTNPFYVAADANGSIYVANTLNDCNIKKYNTNGEFISEFGTCGSGNGEFDWPQGIAVAPNSHLYVADYGNDRIQKFSSAGQFLAGWMSSGTAGGLFHEPRGVAVDSGGDVFVVDSGNNRIQKFNAAGVLIHSWGSAGSDDGQFYFYQYGYNYGGDIAVDAGGHVYVVDTKNYRVQKFTTDGIYVLQWGQSGEGQGQFGLPVGIAAGNGNHVFVADAYNRVLKFTSTGEFVLEWGGSGTADGQFSSIFDIAVDGNGDIYVVDGNDRVQKFSSEGVFINKWGESGTGAGQFQGPWSIAVGPAGNVYVADRHNNRVQIFNPEGAFIQQFGQIGSDPGQLGQIADLGVSSAGDIVIVEDGNHRVQVFKSIESIAGSTKAIIVAGGGPYAGNNLWDSTQMSANFAYRTLTYQGFTKETIFYLTSNSELDIDGNGEMDEVDGAVTGSKLQQAITTWATDADNLVVYLVDHGGAETFRMSGSETVTALELDAWLDQLQQTMPGKVTVIYDACESGSFISQLIPQSGKERVVISSTSPGEAAHFVTQGSVSFSNYFWTHIFNGVNVKDAFDFSRSALSTTTAYQHPLLDANGNGVGNESEDYTLTQSFYIGNGTVIHGDSPVIGSVSNPQTISNQSSSSLFAADVTDNDGISRVWAVIRPPDYTPGDSTNPINDLPAIDLIPVGQDRFEATYDDFNIEGTYQLAIYARDRVGNISPPVLTTVSVNSPLRRRAIIAIGGSQSDSAWQAMENLGTLAYKSLNFQGYTDQDIYFMSPVSFSAGVDGLTTSSNLNAAINTWTLTNTQDVVIYLIGEGGSGTFELNPTETLTAATLDTWIDLLQNNISGKVTVIYDATQSGSFLPLLTPPVDKNRILIASTANDGSAHFLSEGDISFSKFFWRCVLDGMNVRDAFIHAKEAIRYCQNQVPQLDDNRNGIGNEKVDGIIAMDTRIGVGVMLAGDDPLIGSVSLEQTLSGQRSADIWVDDVTTTGTIFRVWAVITPPDAYQPPPDSRIIDLPAIDLVYNGNNGQYEGVCDEFYDQGVYAIAVYAMDAEGNISLPAATQVTQTVSIARQGDIDGNRTVDLADAVVALKVISGFNAAAVRFDYVTSGTDVNTDNRVGLEEVIYILQAVSRLR